MIKIKKSETADTRTCDFAKVGKAELLKSSKQHIGDVIAGMTHIASLITKQAAEHDFTKTGEIDSFHSDFQNGFKDSKWWIKHQESERHHLNDNDYVQDDVNLIDVLEYLVDGVMAGMARSGEYRKEEFPKDLLVRAFDNTVKLLLDEVEVVDK